MTASPGRPCLCDVNAAWDRIEGHLRRTPLELSLGYSELVGGDLYLKAECLQRTGSFKVRGALNALLLREEVSPGTAVVTASAGNHGLGAAFAARLLDRAAVVFIPADAPDVKRRRIEMLGARVQEVDGGYDVAHARAVEYALDRGVPYLHAFSDPAVVAGQGTIALDILSALPGVGTLVVPVGGGGLLGGVGTAMRGLYPSTRVVGVQSKTTSSMYASLVAGTVISVPLAPTLCDGLAGDVDDASLALARSILDDMYVVSEHAVADAIRSLYFEEGLIVEGSGAVGVAAVREGLLAGAPGPIVVLLSGGNIDAAPLARILEAHPDGK